MKQLYQLNRKKEITYPLPQESKTNKQSLMWTLQGTGVQAVWTNGPHTRICSTELYSIELDGVKRRRLHRFSFPARPSEVSAYLDSSHRQSSWIFKYVAFNSWTLQGTGAHAVWAYGPHTRFNYISKGRIGSRQKMSGGIKENRNGQLPRIDNFKGSYVW